MKNRQEPKNSIQVRHEAILKLVAEREHVSLVDLLRDPLLKKSTESDIRSSVIMLAAMGQIKRLTDDQGNVYFLPKKSELTLYIRIENAGTTAEQVCKALNIGKAKLSQASQGRDPSARSRILEYLESLKTQKEKQRATSNPVD